MGKFCDALFEELKTFAELHGMSLNMIHLNKKLLGVEKSNQFPKGCSVYKHVISYTSLQCFLSRVYRPVIWIYYDMSFFLARHWFKGSGATVFIKFCENKCSRLLAYDECDDGFLESLWGALHNADRFLHLLCNRGLWLSQEDALQASDYGLQFCRHYTKAATISLGRHLPRFKHIPNFHMHSHVPDTLAEHARQFGYALNPLVNSGQKMKILLEELLLLLGHSILAP